MENNHRIYADLSDFKRFQRTLIDGEIDGEIAGNLGANLGANPAFCYKNHMVFILFVAFFGGFSADF